MLKHIILTELKKGCCNQQYYRYYGRWNLQLLNLFFLMVRLKINLIYITFCTIFVENVFDFLMGSTIYLFTVAYYKVLSCTEICFKHFSLVLARVSSRSCHSSKILSHPKNLYILWSRPDISKICKRQREREITKEILTIDAGPT